MYKRIPYFETVKLFFRRRYLSGYRYRSCTKCAQDDLHTWAVDPPEMKANFVALMQKAFELIIEKSVTGNVTWGPEKRAPESEIAGHA